MREILFRGQIRKKGEKVNMAGQPISSKWIYGGICHLKEDDERAIIYQREPDIHKFPVYAETVGQYTGLTDKNGIKIFEGDIVCIPAFSPQIMTIAFIEGAFCLADKDGYYVADIHYIHHAGVNNTKVVGNIHDNPELLEVKE